MATIKSIEEKAKAYDEALKVAKDIRNGEAAYIPDGTPVIEAIFPELKESEDDRIRKEIIAFITTTPKARNSHKKWIAWLEKQGKNNMGISEATKQKLEDNLNKALEKETPESWNKFLDEQKLADKVEPKFKVGDWIVYDDNLYHIGNIALQRYYECLRVDGTVHTFSLDIDSKSHLWTIQDAKDGDVLAVEEIEEKYQYPFVAIYKERGLDFFNSYCSIGFDGKFYEGNTGHSTKKIHPATKEQRNLLFQKMKEAGYEWDAEKKELKKIKQKPADTEKGANGNEREIPNSAWSEEDKKIIIQIVDAVGDYFPTPVADKIKNWLKSLKDRVQPKQEWSEEDDGMLQTVINRLELSKNRIASEIPYVGKCVDWLKSLKDRVQPQSKQEWNEDIQQWIDAIIKDYEEWYDADKDHRATIQVKINILKSLKPQSHWKPSDEQMITLEYYIHTLVCNNYKETLFSLYYDLKKLREE